MCVVSSRAGRSGTRAGGVGLANSKSFGAESQYTSVRLTEQLYLVHVAASIRSPRRCLRQRVDRISQRSLGRVHQHHRLPRRSYTTIDNVEWPPRPGSTGTTAEGPTRVSADPTYRVRNHLLRCLNHEDQPPMEEAPNFRRHQPSDTFLDPAGPQPLGQRRLQRLGSQLHRGGTRCNGATGRFD